MKAEFEWLPITKIVVDHQFQRDLRTYWVKRIVRDFDPEKFGTITVSRRTDGAIVVLDGQHRLSAALETLGPDQLVPCLVYDGLTVEREAEVFLGENSRLAISTVETYRAALSAKESWAIAIHDLLEVPVGYRIATGGKGGPVLGCVSALRLAWEHGHLDDVVKVLHGAWPFTGWQAGTVKAMTSILLAHPTLDLGRMTIRLHATTEEDVKRRGQRVMEGEREAGRRSSLEAGIAEVMVRLYNRNLRSGKITRPPKGWPSPTMRAEAKKVAHRGHRERSK
jgi:hypothetical protein